MNKTQKSHKLSVCLLALFMAVCMCISLFATSPKKSFAAESDAGAENATKYQADFATYEEEQAAAAELNIEIAGEGAVLLKNNGVLPFFDVRNVTLLGYGSYNIVTGGGGSGSGSGVANTLVESMTAAGYILNGAAASAYENAGSELSAAQLDKLESSYGVFGDAAVITISRTGSEGGDLERSNVEGHADATEHYLELNDAEKLLLDHAKANFDKVVVLINSSNAMELGPLAVDDGIDAVLWIGHTGNSGIMAVGKMLSGEVNPSGRLIDEYAADFKLDPTWYNFGDNSQTGGDNYIKDSNGNYYYQTFSGTTTNSDRYAALDYSEGIYVGYKYYETVYADLIDGNDTTAADAWYDAWKADCSINGGTEGTGVVYPFGYGLSYTSFDWQIDSATADNAADGTVDFTVTVTNVGDVAGKDVVQLYYTAPYTQGGIEKAAVNLGTFVKTDLLRPGQSQTIDISIDVRDMASFDYNDANNNGFTGYEVEAGSYSVSLRPNVHERKTNEDGTVLADLTFRLSGFTYATDETTGNEITAVFSQDNEFNTTWGMDEEIMMTREGGLKIPTRSAQHVYTQEEYERIDAYNTYSPEDDATSGIQDWVVTDEQIPSTWTQAASETDTANGRNADGTTEIQLIEMAGVEYTRYYAPEDYAATTEGDKAWEEFMNQLTYAEMVSLVSQGNDNNTTTGGLYGLPTIYNNDGPAQLKNRESLNGIGDDGTFWCSEALIASTWNTELAYQQGVMVGNESLFIHVTGWWGPGFDTRRSPFGGRNFEYYSSDGVHGGMIGAAVIRGASSKGCITYMKHFALNDQETDRNTNRGVATWATEQAIREIYLKPFEMAVKEGNTMGMMTGFNRIGAISCAGNYALLNDITRGEWGFKGIYVTDLYLDCRVPGNVCVRAGNDTPLWVGFANYGNISGEWDASARDGKGNVSYTTEAGTSAISSTQYWAVRTAAQRILYTLVNSNGMRNGYDLDSFTGDDTLTVAAGVQLNESLSAQLGADYENYTLVGGSLPDGINLSKDGTLSGKSQVSGVYNFEVEVRCDNWIAQTAAFTLTVTSSIQTEGSFAVGAGEEVEIVFDSDTFRVGGASSNNGTYTDISYALAEGALPAGLVFDDGVIYGTPTETGTFTFTVRLDGAYTYTGAWGNQATGTDSVYETYTLTIGGEDGKTIADAYINADGELVLEYTDGTSQTLGDVTGADGQDGQDGADGADGANGADGASVSVGGIYGWSIALTVVCAALVVAVIVLFVRKRSN